MNAVCRSGQRRRIENMTPCETMARHAGPGPNRIAVTIQNVSSMPMVASTDVKASRYQPDARARTASVIQVIGCAVRTESSTACARTSAPTPVTTLR